MVMRLLVRLLLAGRIVGPKRSKVVCDVNGVPVRNLLDGGYEPPCVFTRGKKEIFQS